MARWWPGWKMSATCDEGYLEAQKEAESGDKAKRIRRFVERRASRYVAIESVPRNVMRELEP